MDPMGAIVKQNNSGPHAVCVPWPEQGHINPMMNLAKLLHHKGFHITFVNTDFAHNSILRSQGPDSLNGLPSFQFISIPTVLPPSYASINKNCLAPLRDLISKLNSHSTNPPVTCIVSDVLMCVTLDVAQHFGIPDALFWAPSACGLVALTYSQLIQKRLIASKDNADCLTNGYLDTVVEGIPGLEGIRLKNFPSSIYASSTYESIRNGEKIVNVPNGISTIVKSPSVSAIVLNTFDDLEDQIMMGALSSILPPIYAIGPVHEFVDKIPDKIFMSSIQSNLWKEDLECLQWLDSKEPNSVIYVNFGSTGMITSQQRVELAWGLANSNKNFLWIIRSDLVKEEDAIVSSEFMKETRERGLITSWCPQEQVLKHPSIAGFLTHCGWNSMLESISVGVPMICWPFSTEQPINSWCCCNKWGIGMEMNGDVSRDKTEKLVRELMDTKKGKEMKMKAMSLKRMAEEAVGPKGSSQLNLDKLIKEALLSKSCPMGNVLIG